MTHEPSPEQKETARSAVRVAKVTLVSACLLLIYFHPLVAIALGALCALGILAILKSLF